VKLSVLIPVYNEEQTIGEVTTEVLRANAAKGKPS